MNLYWTRRRFFHFLSRQNNGACTFEAGDGKIDLDCFCLKMPFFMFSAQIGCSCGSRPHSTQTPSGLWCTTATTPLQEGNEQFFPLGGWGTEAQTQKGAFPRLRASACSGILNQLLQGGVHEVSQASFRTSLWAFFIQQIWCLCFLKPCV